MKKPTIIALAFIALGAGVSGCGLFAPGIKTNLHAAISNARPNLSNCYKQALERDRGFTGPLVIHIKIPSFKNAFTNVRILERKSSDPAFEQCVLEVVRGLKVKSSPWVTVKAEYPVNFNPAP